MIAAAQKEHGGTENRLEYGSRWGSGMTEHPLGEKRAAKGLYPPKLCVSGESQYLLDFSESGSREKQVRYTSG